MVLQLYGYPLSTNTRRVVIVLKEKDVPYEFVEVDMIKGGHKAPETVAHQPFGQLPYLKDGDLMLYESRAIARYVATKYAAQGTPLLPDPADLGKTALADQAASVEVCDFEPHVSALAWENIFKKLYGLSTDESVVAAHLTTLNARLDVYEVILSKTKYLGGDEVSLADLSHLPYGSLLEGQEYDMLVSGSRPNVARWWKDITSRPSWQATKDWAPAT